MPDLFAYCPLPYVRNIFYMDIDLYQYYHDIFSEKQRFFDDFYGVLGIWIVGNSYV